MKILKIIIRKIFSCKVIILLLFLCITAVVLFSKIVPYNMDEFIQYNPIMYNYYKYNETIDINNYQNFINLNLLNSNIKLPLRSWYYSGSFPSLYYYPIFLLWKNPIMIRIIGIFFILFQSLLLGKIFKIKYIYIFIGLLAFFPYSFQHIVDTGPVGFQITSIFLLYYLIKKWFKDFKVIYSLLISLIIFIGIWTKLAYFWLLPGISIFFLIHLFLSSKDVYKKIKANIKKIVLSCLFSFLLLSSSLGTLFLSTDENNIPYLSEILKNQSYSFTEISNPNIFLKSEIFKTLINPFEATQRIYNITNPSVFVYFYDLFIYLSLPLLWFILLKKNKNSKNSIITSALLYLSFIITLIMVIKTKSSWAMHHTILSYPFLILSFFSIFKHLKNYNIFNNKYFGWKIIALIVFIIFNSYFFILFPRQNILLDFENRSSNDFSKNKVNEILHNKYLSNNYFYVVLDWGMFFIQGLYGDKNQGVVYLADLKDKSYIFKLSKLSQKYNRKLLFIYNTSSSSSVYNTSSSASHWNLINNSFDLEQCNLTTHNSDWKILLEPDNNLDNICLKNEIN